MKNFNLDTDYYEFHVRPKFELKQKFHSTTKDCSACNGVGKVGGGFKSLDGPRDCCSCNGNGWMYVHYDGTIPEPPEIPEDYILHMKAAHKAYLDLKQKQKEQNEKDNRITSNIHYNVVLAKNAQYPEYSEPYYK